MKKYVLLVIIGIFINDLVKGQENYKPNIFYSSPEVSELFKQAETPISYQTGIPNINIPLLSVKDFDLSLTYNAGGIKVQDEATSVGLGWNLNIGGSIFRSINQLPDDKGMLNETTYTIEKVYNSTCGNYDTFCLTAQEKQRNGLVDLEPDLFIYNVGNISGKFMFTEDGKIVEFPKSTNQIEPIFENKLIVGWEIVDNQGNYYEFEKGEKLNTTQSYSISSGTVPSIPTSKGYSTYTSWNLKKIKNTKGEEILFSYINKDYNVCRFSNQINYVSGDNAGNIITNYSKQRGISTYLNKIEGEFGKIELDYFDDRQDYISGKRLEKISLYNKSNERIKNISFNYSYSTSIFPERDIYSCGQVQNTQELTKRLILDKISFNNRNQIEEYNYRLEYNEMKLPHKFSYAQDLWGYYNGADNPQLVFDKNNYLNNKVDRSVNGSYNQAQQLKRIVLPTGGSEEYIFEPNRAFLLRSVNNAGNVPIKTKSLSLNTQVDQYEYNLGKYYFRNTFKIDSNALLSSKNYGNTEMYLTMKYNLTSTKCNYGNDLPLSGSCSVYTRLYKKDSPSDFIMNKLTGRSGGITFPVDNLDDEYVLELELYKGSNRSPESEVFDLQNDRATALLNYNVFDSTVIASHNKVESPVGGLRIAEINTFYKDILQLKRRFNYKNNKNEETGESNMVLRFDQSDINTGDIYLNSNTILPFYTSQENRIMYHQVNEKRLDTSTNEEYTTQYLFNYFKPVEIKTPTQPFVSDPVNGTLSQRKVQSIEEETNTYLTDYSSEKKVLGIDYDRPYFNEDLMNARLYGGMTNRNIKVRYSFNESKPALLSRNIKKLFYNNGNHPITTQTDYQYNNPAHQQVTKTTVSNSKGDVIETSYQYAHEKNNTRLINENRIGIPLQTTVTKGGTTVSDQLTQYATFGDLYLPQYIFSKKGATTSSTATDRKLTYDRYDAKGNLLQYHTEDGLYTSILWGYNGQYPIAKVEGARYDEISSYANNISGLRLAVPHAMVTTYTYEPLVGVTSITDPSGQVQTFEYDAFNRLKCVKDYLGKVIKSYEYNYRNQN